MSLGGTGRLRAEGCNEVQGYLFSRPVPPKLIPQLLERWSGIVVIGSQPPPDEASHGGLRQRERKTS
jgi:hypothetical protein